MKRKRQGLFNGYWYALVDGKFVPTTQRVTRAELAEAYRLWAVHKDIRTGVVGAGTTGVSHRPLTHLRGFYVRPAPRAPVHERGESISRGAGVSAELALVRTDEELFEDAIAAELDASQDRWRAAVIYAELYSRGYTQQQIADRVGKDQSHISRCLRVVDLYDPGHNFQDAYDEVKSKIDLGGLKDSVHVEWYTPSQYIGAARAVLGGIDLDPASSELANETVKAERFFSEDDDGLSREWAGRVWLNPPYGKGSGLFATKLVEEFSAGRVTAAILLLNAYGFDSSWFQPLWNYPICFTDHRIVFTSPNRETGGPANANIFAYLGPHDDDFIDAFRPLARSYGECLERRYRPSDFRFRARLP